jgi:hypothetical protein
MTAVGATWGLPPVMAHAFDGDDAPVADPTSWVLDEFLSPSDIVLNARASTKREAFGYLAGLLAERAGGSKEAVLAALLRRERIGPTSIGAGIAMPHGRIGSALRPSSKEEERDRRVTR